MTDKQFLEIIGENRGKSFKWIVEKFSKMGIDMEDFCNMDSTQITEAIIKFGPPNIGSLYTVVYVLRKYMEVSDCPYIYNVSDYRKLWNQILLNNENYVRKFIDSDEFDKLKFTIRTTDDTKDIKYGINNGLWLETIIDALWQGIFSPDLSALNNLTASDVHGNGIVDVKPNKESPYSIQVTSELAQHLIETSQLMKWFRYPAAVEIKGDYTDSVFKFERRKEGSNNYRFTYISRIKKLSEEHLDYSLTPKNIYISGLVSRIVNRVMEYNGFDKYEYEECLKSIFEFKDKRTVFIPSIKDCIKEELERCNYKSEIHTLRKYISGHLNDFIPMSNIVYNEQE